MPKERIIKCVHCEKEFTAYHHRTKVCSEDCRYFRKLEQTNKFRANRTPEQREAVNAYQRKWFKNLSPERKEALLSRNRKY